MRDSVRRCKETFLRTRAFLYENFSAAEPTSFVGLLLNELDSVITGLDSYAGAQAASRSAWRQGTLGRVSARSKLLRELDPYMRNTYANEAAKLAVWLSASRAERRTPRPRTAVQQTAPPNSPTPNTPAPPPRANAHSTHRHGGTALKSRRFKPCLRLNYKSRASRP